MDDGPVEDYLFKVERAGAAIYKINQQINHRFPPAGAPGLDREHQHK